MKGGGGGRKGKRGRKERKTSVKRVPDTSSLKLKRPCLRALPVETLMK